MNWVVLILISAVFIAFRNIFTKKLLFKSNPLPIMLLVSLCSLIGIIFFKNQISFELPQKIFWLLVIKSLVICVAWIFMYKAYQKLELSTVSPLNNLSPIFLIILSLIFLGENITLINYLGIGLIMISAYVLEIKLGSNLFSPLKLFKSKYFVYILIAMVGGSISAVLDKLILKEIGHYSLLFFFYLFTSIIYIITVIYKRDYIEIKNLLKLQNLSIIIGITVFTLIADITYVIAAAIPTTLIVLLIPLRRLSTFISTLVGGRFFKEKNILYKGGICLMMILGVYLIII
ncbi:MAG: EamA family transporter [Nanoarchaeota archaeon]|nr:EamA family transporter [Nanoarchaeota archaeon]